MDTDDTLQRMRIEIRKSLLDIPAVSWDHLNTDANPFTSYAFLAALEHSGCVGTQTGWSPSYLLMYDEQEDLIGALPMYEKKHSWGEYVFDWVWAEAWHRAGLQYYPKLIVAVPFSPVTGSRILALPGPLSAQIRKKLAQAAMDHTASHGYSSLHWLFPDAKDCEVLRQENMLLRHDVQFRWKNNHYRDFEDFLAAVNSRKRKKIKRERRRIIEAGIEYRTLNGAQLDSDDMDRMYEFYLATIRSHGSHAYLNREFFRLLQRDMAENIVIIEAHKNGGAIAAALNIRHQDVLYGRYWGCQQMLDSLHFETCYYQAIDYCINQGIRVFEGGAQGEHKLSRGFHPQITCSAHWFTNAALASDVAGFLEREKVHVAHYERLLLEHAPYKTNTS